MTFMSIMNSSFLYICVAIGLLAVCGMCVVTMKQAWVRAVELGVSDDKLKDLVKSSAVFTVIPSLSVVIGLFSLQAAIGVPWSWFRLSVLGAVGYELVAADMAASGAGYESLSALVAANDPTVVGSVMLAMSIGIIGGCVGVVLLTKKLHVGMSSYADKTGAWGAIMMGCFILGMFSVFIPARSIFMGSVATLTFLTSVAITLFQRWLVKAKGMKWLSNFILANALIFGMASSLLWTALLK